ncbi:ATP-binding cassette sub-family A member 13 [Dromiciops gliroides]|uniref:ATP-binding cassette sub-family A member 13 n=1 Tax=Dromiciops gliroides TaxID=33562 RepID=UPI001CC3CC08|nr:ATP-binding cassette sub-family A member 13 [Dromiciops gliroides]
MGGQSLRQFQALFWKNWLCRLRQPVLSLSEFLWPCTLFLILTVIRFQEPPRHRDNCYLQPRNLPSQGVYPFVQSLLCNAGSRCKNTSYAVPKDPQFRISRSSNSQDHQGMGTNLAFLEDIRMLAQGISETMEKAVALQKVWMEGAKLSGSQNSAFSMVDLNKTETLISKIEKLHHQPYFWNFLRSLPGLRISKLNPEYGLQVLAQFLQTVLSSLASLEDLDWLPINQTFSKAAQIGLNVTITILEFLQEEKPEAIGPGYNLSLRNVVWNPQKLKSDLTSKYGFDDLRVEKMLNYTGELNEILTDSSLEQFVCSALSNTSEVEVGNNYNHGNCNTQWSEAKDYLVHSVSWLQIYKEVIQQWINGSVVQKILTGMEKSLVAFIDQYHEDSESQKVASVLHTMIHLLDDSLGPDSLPTYLQSPKILVHLAKFQTILQSLPHWPTVKRLLLVNGALRNVIIQNLHFIREVLSKLERLAPFSETDDLSSLQLEMDTIFRDLKQDGIFQKVLFGRTNQTIAITEDFLGWQEIEQQFAESTTFCSWLYQSLSTQLSPGENTSFIYCQEQIISTLVFHTLEEVQFALEQNNSWKNLTEFLRKTCEVAHYVNKQESFQRIASATSENSPCKGAKLDWEVITDTYFVFLKNLLESPRTSVSRILMYTKDLLEMEKKSHTYEDEVTTFWIFFVDFVEKMVVPGSLASSNHPIFQNLANLTEVIWNKILWWKKTSKSSEAEPSSLNTQKFSEFSKELIEKIQVVSNLWKRNEYEEFLRILELILYEINPKLLELWMYGIPKRERDRLETLSTLLNLSIPENQRVLGKNFNFSLHFHSLSESGNLNLDFVHLSEIIINSLYDLGLVKQEQVTAALHTVYALQNISILSSSFSISQKQYLENILTQIYQNVFQDKDSVVLLQLYSSIYQDIFQFISSFQNRKSLLTFFIQISKSISAIIKEFNFQDMSKAFEFLSEVTSFLDRISEESLCEKLFSVYNYLAIQVKSLIPKEDQEIKMIHATLMSLKQLLIIDKNFRMSLLHYLNQLFNNSLEGHLNTQCFDLDDRPLPLNWSMDVSNSLILPWIQILSNLTENIVINGSLAMQCTFSWVQVWFDIFDAMSQVLKFDSKFFPSLQIGLRELSSELGNSFEHSEICQRMFPDHVPIKLITSLLKHIVQDDDDARNWNALTGLSSVLDNSLAIMKSLNTEKVEKSLLKVENTVLKLKEYPLNINISRQFIHSLFEVFMELSNTTGNIDRELTGSREDYETAFIVLQETIRFLRNVSYGQDLLSCAGVLQNITTLVMEGDLTSKNASQKLLSMLAIFNSILTSENIINRVEDCTAWIDIIRNLGVKYNTSSSLGHSKDFLELFLSSRNVNDTKIKVRKMLDFVTFILSSEKPLCSLNNSDMHCLDVYFRNVTNFVKVVITTLFEKEKMPMLDFILRILNNSEDQIRIIINNLTRTLEFSSDVNWKNFTQLIIRALEKSGDSPKQFQIVWWQSIAFLREIQKLVRNITVKILEDNSSEIGKVLKIFMNLPKEKSANVLGDSIQNLGSYFAFNLSYDLQNSPTHAIMKAIGLDIQLVRDVINSLLPSILPNIPQNSGYVKVLKKISTLLRNLKNADVELLVDQLEQISGSLWDFLKNISTAEDGNSGIDLLVGLMKTFVHSSHSWNINHLWQLSRLFPKDEVDAVVDAYYMLPEAVKLLQRIAHKNITEALLEVYNFTLAHGASISTITKEDFASAIKDLLDITELVIDKPNTAAEVLSCLPVTWCSNHTTVQLHKDIVMEKCNIHKSVHPLLYSKMADLFHHLQMMPLEADLQCSNESLRIEMTHRVYCLFHELAAWNAISIKFSEALHLNNSLLKELQGFWYEASPYILSSGKSSNANDSIHCMVLPGKWIALRVIEKLKKVNFTKVLSIKDILEQLTGLNKIQLWNVKKETSVLNKIITNLKRWTNLVAGIGVENLTFFLPPSLPLSSRANQISDLLKVLLGFGKTSNITDNLETPWLESERFVQDLRKNFSIRHIFSSVKQGIQIITSLTDQNITLPLSYVLKKLNSSSLHGARFVGDLILVTRDLLQEYTNGNFSTIIDMLIFVLTNESSPHARTLRIDEMTDFLEYFKNVSREGFINTTFVAHLLNLGQQANFSVLQFLFESSLIRTIDTFARSSLEAALHLSDTDLPIMDFIDLVFNYTQFENKGNLSLYPSSTMKLFKQFFHKFFFPPKGKFENKTFALLKDLYPNVMAEMSIAPMDKILDLLKLDPFTSLREEDRLPGNYSSLRKNISDLITDSFILEDGEFYFDIQQKLKFIRDLFHVILRDIPTRNDIENDAEMVMNKTHLVSKMKNFEDLVEFNEDLDSAIQSVRKSSAKIVSIMDIIFSYNIKDLHAFSSTLQVVLANLTELVTFVDNIFSSKERKVVEIIKQLLDVIAYGEKDFPEAFLEMSRALSTLLQDIKKLQDLSLSVDAMVKFLKLSKKVSAQVAAILETHFISKTKGKLSSLDMLYSFLQEAVHSVVDDITSMRNIELLSYQEVESLLKPLLDVISWTIEIKPFISKGSKPLNKSTSSLSYLSLSKNISEIAEEIAVFIINSKNHSGELEHLVLALKNTTQTLSIDVKTLMEEVLDCLVPINNLTSQVEFLNFNLNSSHHWLWDTKWERLYKMVLFWNEILSQNSPESGAKLKMVIALSLEALGNNLQEGGWDIFNLLLTFTQHPNNLSQAIESTGKMLSVSGGEFSKALFFNSSTIHNMTHQQLEKAIQVALNKIALWMEWLLLHHSQWRHSTKALFPLTWETSVNVTTGKGVMSKPPNNIKREKNNFSLTFKTSSCFEKYIKGIVSLAKYWQKGPLQNQSVLEICQFFQKHLKPSTALTLQKVKMTVLNVLSILAEKPSFTKDLLCTFLSCKDGLIKHLLSSILQGVTLVHGHYQDFENIWSSSNHGHCENLLHTSNKLFSTLESFKRSLRNATVRDCECHPMLETVQQHVQMLARSLEKPLSGDPIMVFLSNLSVNGDVKLKDCVQNVTKLRKELRSLTIISEETINNILEANISHSKFLSSALTVALAGKCDEEVISLLLTFPADGKALAARELCALPASDMYTLIVLISQNLDLRIITYKMLIPPEANSVLNSLLDVVSSINSLLIKAQHILKYLPEFLQSFKNIPLLDISAFPQFPQDVRSQSSTFGSLQSVMKMVCKEEASFLSNSNMYINLPRVNDLLEDDKTKFNIPKDSTPFCLKLYKEILQSPNGALVWAFLKPLLHGKILYTPNTPVINKVIEKANYTFVFVDKLKIAFEAMLKMSSIFQKGGNAQMIKHLQEVLRNTFIKTFIESQLQIDVEKFAEKLQNYAGMLGKMFNHSKAEQFHSLAQIMVNISSCVLLNRFKPLESVEILEREAHGLMQQNNLLASIIFNSSSRSKRHGSDVVDLPHHFIYTIRTSVLYSMRTDLVKNPLWKFHPQSLPSDGFKYNYIFVPLQDMIERAIILVQTGLDTLTPSIQAQAMPYPCHTSDLFLNNVGFFFPLIMMLTWMVSVASMVRKLVYEREIRLEEYMRMMGVHPTVYFLAWFLENIIMLIISSCALAIILKTSGIFAHSNAIIIFLFLLDFGVSVVMLSFLLSAFFSNANTAALCTSLVYMISFLPYIILLVLHNHLSFAIQTVLCFLSTTAFGQGVFFITFLEGQEAGIQWNNMYQSLEQGDMTFGWVCWMILFDSMAYFICGWYFSNLIPGNFGLRKPWNFPFTMSYWQNLCGFKMRKQQHTSYNLFFNENFMNKGSLPPNGQKTLEDRVYTGVTLVSVTKEYEGDKKAAVKELTLTFYKGQITALLGPNGAGKTTIISLLTGLYPPSSGTIIINGKDMQTQLAAIRMEMGVCPQYDVLFDNLSVREHLLLFASIKAPLWTKKQLYQQVNKTLQDVELTHHQNKHVRALSGGMKRKLSIAIAFIGNSNVVVLDEPTSGVDPCARRGIWDILLKYRAGRTLIFTTHHLDEAEVLSDRIAILQHGQLRCSGSPSSLKEAYGHGLTLTLTKQPFILQVQDAKDIDQVTSLIQIYIPQAFLKENGGNELTYAIPKDTDKACFKGLFQALDQNLHHLHLTGYGISDTTLEEVFLKLLQDSKNKQHVPGTRNLESIERSTEQQNDNNNSHRKIRLSQGAKLLLTQMAALLVKRFHHTRRGWKGTLSDLVLPVLFVALAMGLFMVKPLVTDYPSLKLTPGHYDNEEAYFFSSESGDTGLSSVLLRSFSVQDPLCENFRPDLKKVSCWQSDPFPPRAFQDSCGCLKCPKENTSVPYLKNSAGHTLFNLSALDIEEHLLLPSKKPRLGGWSFGVKVPNQGQDTNINMSESPTLAKVWYNQKGFHALPSYLNHLNNLILWQHLPASVNWRQYGITLYSHPYGGTLLNEDKIMESVRQCGVALCIMLGFSILTASIGSSVVKDRVCGAKRLQHISGLGYGTYWLTNFIYDMLFYLVSVSLSIGVIVAFQLTAFTFRENLAATALLLALFGYATLPWMYLLSRIFSSSDVAFISYISLNFIFGLCTMLMTIMPRLLAVISKAQNLQNIYNVLKWVFTIFPQFCLGQGLIELCYNQIKFDLTHNFGIDSYVSPFEMNFLGWIFLAMALQGTTLLLLRILLHWDLIQKPRNQPIILGPVNPSEDMDVKEEKMRIWTGRTNSDILVLRNLRKSYQGFGKRSTAVNDISLGIPRGECFGLLGVNGAGKSTTFKMLTGDIIPSSGYAAIRNPEGGEMVLSSSGATGVLIGYCPQKDALDEFLTGWEHLYYYCSLRGIPKQEIHRVAGELVNKLHLEAHIEKPVNTYSGGTKRKLSTALALVGKPEILLLDEPSSGMDPGSKRYLWKTIMKEVQEGCAAILTSHSMEECEALCTRLAIMVDGSFKCLGSPQHIKNRFGAGYTVKVWLSQETSQHNSISDCLKLHFPGIQFKGQHLNLLEYHVPQRWGCLADLFKVLENNKTLLNIKHYSINQTTLEQVFISFATQQQQTPYPTFESSTNYIHPYPVSI